MAKQAEPVEGYLDDEFAKFRTQRLNKGKEAHVEPNARSTRVLARVEAPAEPGARSTSRLTKLDEMLAAKREEARAATVRLAPVEPATATEEPAAPARHHPHCALLDMDPSRGTRACNCQTLDPASAAHRRPTPPSQAHRRPEAKAVQPDSRAHPKPVQDSKAHPKPVQPDSKGRLEPDTPASGTARATRRIAVLPPEEAGNDFERFRAQRLRETEAARQAEPAAAPAEHAAPVEVSEAELADDFEKFRAQRLRESKRHKKSSGEHRTLEPAKVEAAKAEPEVVDPEFEKFRLEREKALEEQKKAEEALAAVPIVERPAETALLGAVVEAKPPAAGDDGMFFGTNHRERIQIRAAAHEHRGNTPPHGLDVHAVAAVAEADAAARDTASDEAKTDEAKADEAKRRAPPPPLPTR